MTNGEVNGNALRKVIKKISAVNTEEKIDKELKFDGSWIFDGDKLLNPTGKPMESEI